MRPPRLWPYVLAAGVAYAAGRWAGIVGQGSGGIVLNASGFDDNDYVSADLVVGQYRELAVDLSWRFEGPCDASGQTTFLIQRKAADGQYYDIDYVAGWIDALSRSYGVGSPSYPQASLLPTNVSFGNVVRVTLTFMHCGGPGQRQSLANSRARVTGAVMGQRQPVHTPGHQALTALQVSRDIRRVIETIP